MAIVKKKSVYEIRNFTYSMLRHFFY